MNGKQALAAAGRAHGRTIVQVTAQPAEMPIRFGFIAAINTPAADPWSAVITGLPNQGGAALTIPEAYWSSVFRAEVVATISPATLTGRRVEVHFSDSQPVIAYTVGG